VHGVANKDERCLFTSSNTYLMETWFVSGFSSFVLPSIAKVLRKIVNVRATTCLLAWKAYQSANNRAGGLIRVVTSADKLRSSKDAAFGESG
jgi:hypothetical protein